VSTQRSATIKDIASRAEVSIATVSRVLNAKAGVSDAASEAVLAAARQLGFRPNQLGRNLRAARSATLGVMLPRLGHPVFAECLQGIEQAARGRGLSIVVSATDYDRATEEAVSEQLLRQRVDGLILTVADAADNPLLDKLDAEGVPYVLVFNQPLAAKAAVRSSVGVDNRAAAREMVQQLLAWGHREIHMLAGQFGQSDRARQRFAGYCDAMQQAGRDWRAPLQVPFTTDDTRDVLLHLLHERPQTTALFCSNDQLTMTVVRDLRALGLFVPGDISVAGFDGVQTGALMHPPLTTVSTPTVQIGRAAVALLGERIAGAAPQGAVLLPHALVPGGTAREPSPIPPRLPERTSHADPS
jgi:DNA-binding LacI/PurR family transcriptional regulator